MGWFSKKPSQQQYINSVIKVASNLYLDTLSAENDFAKNISFERHDSKYRYLIFCFSTVITSVLAYDNKKGIQPEVLFNGCVQFLNWTAKEFPEEYFTNSGNSAHLLSETVDILGDYLRIWSHWPELEIKKENEEIIDLICKIIRSTESEKPATNVDNKRLSGLGLEIDCLMPTMRSSVEELAKRN